MALPVKQKMVFEKKTTRTIRYQALPTPGQSTVISTLYVSKAAFNSGPHPDYITIVVMEGLQD